MSVRAGSFKSLDNLIISFRKFWLNIYIRKYANVIWFYPSSKYATLFRKITQFLSVPNEDFRVSFFRIEFVQIVIFWAFFSIDKHKKVGVFSVTSLCVRIQVDFSTECCRRDNSGQRS